MESLKKIAVLEVEKLWKNNLMDIHDDCIKKKQEESERHIQEKKRHMQIMQDEDRLHRENLRMLTIEKHRNLLTIMQVHKKFHSDILQKTVELIRTHRECSNTYICYNFLNKIYVDKTDDGQLTFLIGSELSDMYEKYNISVFDLNIYRLFMTNVKLECTSTQMSIADILFMF